MTGKSLDYRPELDGLRAIAVASVVAFHLEPALAPGGFVGVDIFFVLSGFLIARLIANELTDNSFTFLNFYERRVRRILPALVVVCAFSAIAATFILLPEELVRFAKTLVAAAFSVSNIWFKLNSDYFAPAAETQPLLHTWSLGVEEQFYLGFPVFLWAVYKWWRPWLGVLIGLALLTSLAIANLRGPQATFFLIDSRAWEFLIGSVVALRLIPEASRQWQRALAGLLGLLGLGIAIFAFNSHIRFPGVAALLPCVAVALVIWGGSSDTLATRVLTWRPMVFLGLISYSVYLWHWPLIVFTKLLTAGHSSGAQKLSLVAATLVLATLSWRYVETPCRRRGVGSQGWRKAFLAGGFGIGALAACGGGFLILHGLPGRFPDSVFTLAAAAADSSPLRPKCHFSGNDETFEKTCVLGADVPPSLIVYADSHGVEMSVALGEAMKQKGTSLRQITASSCPPARGFNPLGRPNCAAYNERMLRSLTAVPPTTIIVAAKSVHWLREDPKTYLRGLGETLQLLARSGHHVILLGAAPPHPHHLSVPATLARLAAVGVDPNTYTFDPGMAEMEGVDRELRQIADGQGATFVSISPAFCSRAGCAAYLDDAVLYFDDNHLSVAGAKIVVSKRLAPVLWPEDTSRQSATH